MEKQCPNCKALYSVHTSHCFDCHWELRAYSLLPVLAAIGPFSDCAIGGSKEDLDRMLEMIDARSPRDAVALVLASILRNDSVIGPDDLVGLGEALGIFEDE